MTSTRLVGLILLVVMIACGFLSWTMFTGWGLLASYVGSHKGGMVPQSELDAAAADALRMFWFMIALQAIMFTSSGFFVWSLMKGRRSRFWPSLKSWMVGLLLGAGVDGIVIAAMFYRQTRG
ncbi:MAG: hypothetical protein LC130_03530 [Bryobacterales bacterium]|nr:hypothetical protein [Bryobacterales bacterium]